MGNNNWKQEAKNGKQALPNETQQWKTRMRNWNGKRMRNNRCTGERKTIMGNNNCGNKNGEQ